MGEGNVYERKDNWRSEVLEQAQGVGIHNLGGRVFLRRGHRGRDSPSFVMSKRLWA